MRNKDMRIENIEIEDVILSEDFIHDYYMAPMQVRKKVDSLLRMLQQGKKVPNSMRARCLNDYTIWRGWVTQGHKSWRVLFELLIDNRLYFLRLVDHDIMDEWLKNDSL